MFPAYREFTEALEISNSVIGSLDIAAALSLITLADKRLADPIRTIFPSLPQGRFLQTGAGVHTALRRSGHELTAMAIPVALSAYERLAKDALERLRRHGTTALDENEIRLLGLDRLHGALGSAGLVLPPEDSQLWEFARLLRNRIVHAAQTIGELRSAYLAVGTARSEWQRLTGRDFLEASAGPTLSLTLGEAIGVIALCRRLGHAINTQLQLVLSRQEWVGIMIDDYREHIPSHTNDPGLFSFRLMRYRAFHYPTLSTTRVEIEGIVGHELRDRTRANRPRSAPGRGAR